MKPDEKRDRATIEFQQGKASSEAMQRANMVRDPVCGMEIQKREPVASSQYRSRVYYFHSEACKAAFDRAPARYAAKGRRHTGTGA